MPNLPAQARFRKLVDDISGLYLRARATQGHFAWETGRRIVEEEQNGSMRAQYGTGLISALSKTLSERYGPGFSADALRKMRQFYLRHRIQPPAVKLGWFAHVELMPVKDEKTRRRLEQRILKEGLTRAQLRRILRNMRNASADKPATTLPPLKRPADLKLHTFAKSALSAKLNKDEVLIDCGFFLSWPVKKADLAGINITDRPSYTYAAAVDRVIDGDTLHVLIEAGFGSIVHYKLRLRGIDTPELGTPEGDRAKRYVEKLLPPGSALVIKTHKEETDTYGRFVADVFYREGPGGAGSPEEILSRPVYLNQQLLDEGLAVRMAE